MHFSSHNTHVCTHIHMNRDTYAYTQNKIRIVITIIIVMQLRSQVL